MIDVAMDMSAIPDGSVNHYGQFFLDPVKTFAHLHPFSIAFSIAYGLRSSIRHRSFGSFKASIGSG